MNVEDTMREYLLRYPQLYPNALSLCDHLFCTIGNGFEWENGELVEIGRKKPEDLISVIREVVKDELQIFMDFEEIPPSAIKALWESKCERVDKALSLIQRIPERMKEFEVPSAKDEIIDAEWQFYPICEYSKMCKLPDNIKDDWLALVHKFYDFVMSHKELLYPFDKDGQLEWLQKIGKRIEELENR